MSAPKYKLKPVAIANQIANLEPHELKELASHLESLHPLDISKISENLGQAFCYSIIEEKIDEIKALEAELEELKNDLCEE